MKILCITSSQPGHMDFGGKGFVRLAKSLQSRGHYVTWLSFGAQVERLRKAGCIVDSLPAISGLPLMPFFNAGRIDLNKKSHQFRIDSIRNFYDLLNREMPDVLIIDRLLAYGAFAAEQLNIPYIGMGTPGGYWRFEKIDQGIHVFPVTQPVDSYRIYGEALKKILAWSHGEINTFWVNSPYLNIGFMTRDFFSTGNVHNKVSASVYHHQDIPPKAKGKRLGISFGNQGNQQLLLKFLDQAVALFNIMLPIDVFVGNNERTYHELNAVYRPEQITLHRWVDFDEYFPDLSCLAFLGGVGTIWQCIDHGLPMLIIPGNIGDQRYNAERVQAMGAGIHLEESDLEKSKLATAITHCCENRAYRDQIDKLRSPDNYTDTLDSICERIESRPI